MADPLRILETSHSILLVDWPDTGVPRALLESGFAVFGYSPGRYSCAEISEKQQIDVQSAKVFAPRDNERGFLIFRRLDAAPSHVDIVNVYRPEAEIPGIVAQHATSLMAKVLWLQSPIISVE